MASEGREGDRGGGVAARGETLAGDSCPEIYHSGGLLREDDLL